MEKWREVVGYSSSYIVSDLGRIKSLISNKILKVNYNVAGYGFVNLYKNKKPSARMIHQLVAESWLYHVPCGQKLVVDHINGDKKDNRLINLQIITQRKNSLKDKELPPSGHHGVSWCNTNKKWVVRPRYRGKKVYLGHYDCADFASEVYQHFTNYVDDYVLTEDKLIELKVIYKDKLKKLKEHG